MHPAAADYVTDLAAMLTVGRRQVRAPDAFVTWPEGPEATPVLWTTSEQRALAPQGVLRPELRVWFDDDPEGRLLPDVSDLAPPAVRTPSAGADTGVAP
jgi:hypothetical protein